MSMLDPVQNTLAKDVWTEDRQLRPEIKKEILTTLYSFLPKKNIKEVDLIGTITGYQNKPTSDIDVNVLVYPPELAEDRKLKAIRKSKDGQLAKGTQHPVNFFIRPYLKESNWQDVAFGVYNVLEDKWEAEPGSPDSIRDPQEEYRSELLIANMYIRKFEMMIKQWETLKAEFAAGDEWEKERLGKVLKDQFLELVEFCHDVDRERKFEYAESFGIPRKNWRNVIYKAIEGTTLEPYFHFFKEIKVDDYYTQAMNILREITNE